MSEYWVFIIVKTLFNTRKSRAAASAFYIQALANFPNIHFRDWNSYCDFDVALFMSYPQDLKEIPISRQKNPKLKIGLIDPRGSINSKIIDDIDFIIVDSLEMRDFFSKYQRPIFTYYEYPDLKPISKKHEQKDTIIIGYHGNKVHLESMYPRITSAIKQLGQRYSIEFWAMYNVAELGEWKSGFSSRVPVRHVQWSEENYYKYLAAVDIGIVPNIMPINNLAELKRKSVVWQSTYLDRDDDYLLKFKLTSNAGRIIVFGLLGLPIVADMYPSAMQFITDGEDGFVAYSTAGWYRALEKLIKSEQLRQEFSDKLRGKILDKVDNGRQNERLMRFLEKVISQEKSERTEIIEQQSSKSRGYWIYSDMCLLLGRVHSKLRNLLKSGSG